MKNITVDKRKIKRVLNKSVLFSGVNKSYIDKLLDISNIYSIKKGEKVVLERQFGRDIFILIEGEIIIYFQDKKRRVILKILTSGDIFGEVGFFTKRRTANCEAVKDSIICILKYKKLQQLVKEEPQILINMIKILLSRLIDTDLEIKNLAFRSVLQRLSNEILQFAKNKNVVEVPISVLTQKVVASRETVSRMLNLLEKIGAIKREKKKLVVTDRGKLEEIL